LAHPPDAPRPVTRADPRVSRHRDFVAVYESEADVRALRPDFGVLARIDALGVVATARGESCDFVSRFFAPAAGVPTHCELIPYWSGRLGKKSMRALQVSARGGEFLCADLGNAVDIAGRAVLYLEGAIVV
jgi:predicted PhzF superfamily epimerase YddE/YHI9